MFFSAFQWNAFWNRAFQIGRNNGETESTDGGGYVHPYQAYKEKEYQRLKAEELRAELKRVDDELAEAERLRVEKLEEQRKLKARNAAKKLAALEAQLQEEINRLRIERVWLMRRLDDEEAALVLMLAPFH